MSVAVGVVNLTRVTLLSDRVLVKGNIVGDEGLAFSPGINDVITFSADRLAGSRNHVILVFGALEIHNMLVEVESLGRPEIFPRCVEIKNSFIVDVNEIVFIDVILGRFPC